MVIPDCKRTIAQLLNSLLSEKGTDASVLLCVLDVLKGWIEHDFSKLGPVSSSSFLNPKEVVSFLQKLSQVDKQNFLPDAQEEWERKFVELLFCSRKLVHVSLLCQRRGFLQWLMHCSTAAIGTHPTDTTAEVPQSLKKELSGVCRACSSADAVNEHVDFVREHKREFERDLDPESTATLSELTEHLKHWKNVPQSNVEDGFPSVLNLEDESKVLRDLHLVDACWLVMLHLQVTGSSSSFSSSF